MHAKKAPSSSAHSALAAAERAFLVLTLKGRPWGPEAMATRLGGGREAARRREWAGALGGARFATPAARARAACRHSHRPSTRALTP